MIRAKAGSGNDFQKYVDKKYHNSVIQRINSARGDLERMSKSINNRNESPLKSRKMVSSNDKF